MKRACKFLYVTLIFSSILTACSKETVSNNSDMGLETLQPIITAEKEKFKGFQIGYKDDLGGTIIAIEKIDKYNLKNLSGISRNGRYFLFHNAGQTESGLEDNTTLTIWDNEEKRYMPKLRESMYRLSGDIP